MSERNPSPSEQKRGGSGMDTYFQNILVLNRVLSEPGRAFEDSHAPAATSRADRAVLYLGCNLLRTPHLAQLAAGVMHLLAPTLSVLGGPSHCCGTPMPDPNDRAEAAAQTISHFQQEQAATVVTWCPSCHNGIRTRSDPASWGFEELHITEFIARHLDRLALRPQTSARIMLHGHTGASDRDRDLNCCRQILQAIPGVTIVGEHADADLGLQCVPAIIASKIGAEACERKLQAVITQAREAGAEMLVTIYHSCYRELEKRLQPGSLLVENYITLLAKALDLAVPANLYRELAHGDTERLVQIANSAAANAIDGKDFEAAMTSEFPGLLAK